MKKVFFTQQVIGAATDLAILRKKLSVLQDAYQTRGYNPGGANAITDDDVSSFEITASQLSDFLIEFGVRFNLLMTAGAPLASIYGDAYLNALRTDF